MRSYSRVCLVYYCLFFVFYFFWYYLFFFFFFFSSRRRHTRSLCDWSSDVCSSDLKCSPRSLEKLPAGNLFSILVFAHGSLTLCPPERHDKNLLLPVFPS